MEMHLERLPLHLLALTLGACATCLPLSDVPIAGGTPEQAGAVAAELTLLEGVLALPVCLDHVRIGRMSQDGWAGRYERRTHRMVLDERQDLSSLDDVLRHEMCHAVDFQNDIVRADEELWHYVPAPENVDGRTPNEAFADTCGFGPDAVRVLWAAECPADPDLGGAHAVRAQVWGQIGQADAAAWVEPVASAAFAGARDNLDEFGAFWGLEVYETVVADRLRIVTSWEHAPAWAIEVDARTGELLDGSTALAGRPAPTPDVVPAGWFSTGGSTDVDRGGHVDGLSVTVAELHLPTGVAHRVHVSVDGTWVRPEDPCPSPDHVAFFLLGSELWMAESDGVVVRWGRWRAQ